MPGKLQTVIFILLLSPIFTAPQPYKGSIPTDRNISFHTIAVSEHQLHYASSGDQSKPGIIFIHGTPGDWSAFETYLNNKSLQHDFFMVSIDRLGWGLSLMSGKKFDSSFELQALGIVALFKQYPNKKWTIVGHSLGASLAPRIALHAPDQVRSLLLLTGSLNPKL